MTIDATNLVEMLAAYAASLGTNAVVVATNAPPGLVEHAVDLGQWNWLHTALSGVGGIGAWRYLKLELPNIWSFLKTAAAWMQSYCDTHEGGLIEFAFHKIFGKPVPVKQTADAPPIQPAANEAAQPKA